MPFWGRLRDHSRGKLGIDPYGSFGSGHGSLRISVMSHLSS